ncbi:MAG: type III polyketide synthase [Bacteroidota bacterium]|nr:type III polyketide synthase [Bacteroidota bacterium]
MSKIISIGTAVPEYGTEQSVILDFMKDAYSDDIASRKLNVLFKHSGISTRYSTIPDFDRTKSRTILFNEKQDTSTVENRLTIFKEKAVPLAIEAITNALKKTNANISDFGITHLITVSCTGLYAPGIDAELIEELNLPNDTFHISVNFLGCNAAFHALKIADLITRSDDNAKVLIVCVELCTLHFQPKNNHDNLLSNTIFGDGAAAVIITSDINENHYQQNSLVINGFYSLLLPKGKDLMGWNITPVNFEMILDAKIPDFIGNEINAIILKASEKFNIEPNTIKKWAVHPGGKKILDTIKKELQLNEEDLKYSYKILDEYGNMSSPTILFVLNELMEEKQNKNDSVFSIGFGPGLSIETALFRFE